jgi:protein LSM14
MGGHHSHHEGNAWQNPRRPPAHQQQQHQHPYHQQQHQPPAAPLSKLDFKEDFDFEKSNAQLTSMVKDMHLSSASKAVAEASAEPAAAEQASDTFYDPSKSFFDNISCEALERQAGVSQPRKTRFEESSINAQTFGAEGANYKSVHARRRGRGGNSWSGRGRGGNTSGGGGYPRDSAHHSGSYNSGGSSYNSGGGWRDGQGSGRAGGGSRRGGYGNGYPSAPRDES